MSLRGRDLRLLLLFVVSVPVASPRLVDAVEQKHTRVTHLAFREA